MWLYKSFVKGFLQGVICRFAQSLLRQFIHDCCVVQITTEIFSLNLINNSIKSLSNFNSSYDLIIHSFYFILFVCFLEKGRSCMRGVSGTSCLKLISLQMFFLLIFCLFCLKTLKSVRRCREGCLEHYTRVSLPSGEEITHISIPTNSCLPAQ